MITGEVIDYEAIVTIEALSSSSVATRLQAAIDTGYNGYITFPAGMVTSFDLTFAGHRGGTLADGSTVILDVYLGNISWHGQRREVLIAQADGIPLIGMALLEGSRLTIDVVEHGRVVIDEFPTP